MAFQANFYCEKFYYFAALVIDELVNTTDMITTTATYFMLFKTLEFTLDLEIIHPLNVFLVVSKGSSKKGVDNIDNGGNWHILSVRDLQLAY